MKHDNVAKESYLIFLWTNVAWRWGLAHIWSAAATYHCWRVPVTPWPCLTTKWGSSTHIRQKPLKVKIKQYHLFLFPFLTNCTRAVKSTNRYSKIKLGFWLYFICLVLSLSFFVLELMISIGFVLWTCAQSTIVKFIAIIWATRTD